MNDTANAAAHDAALDAAHEPHRASGEQASTLLSELVDVPLTARPGRRHAYACLEAMLVTALSLGIARLLAPTEAGIVSLFLSAAALSPRLHDFLDENRRRAWSDDARGANRTTAASIGAMFLGMLVAYAGAAALLGASDAASAFAFALRAAGVRHDDVITRALPAFLPTLQHNLVVALVLFVLAFLYRGFGALLALGWNACVWGFVWSVLVTRAMQDAAPGHALLVGALYGPHLLVEGCAYVLVALAGIFLSKGVLKYGLRDARLPRVVRVVLRLLVVGACALTAAALLEARLGAVVRSVDDQRRVGSPLSVGRPAAVQALMPPRTLLTFV